MLCRFNSRHDNLLVVSILRKQTCDHLSVRLHGHFLEGLHTFQTFPFPILSTLCGGWFFGFIQFHSSRVRSVVAFRASMLPFHTKTEKSNSCHPRHLQSTLVVSEKKSCAASTKELSWSFCATHRLQKSSVAGTAGKKASLPQVLSSNFRHLSCVQVQVHVSWPIQGDPRVPLFVETAAADILFANRRTLD